MCLCNIPVVVLHTSLEVSQKKTLDQFFWLEELSSSSIYVKLLPMATLWSSRCYLPIFLCESGCLVQQIAIVMLHLWELLLKVTSKVSLAMLSESPVDICQQYKRATCPTTLNHNWKVGH